ncbi:KAP family P-loop NTPase fold protein [Serratia liquefaciens]|uniref:KAP family P-loop NTPase fold protein n=1 Tax=Serratia liquefaciens TaxID=614 RepID=UPI00061B6953|nr:P-loop NTPase fold protein [Serratia liquefaciens]AKE12254.1 hypothetical protein XJ20_21040 [Serratia liquefaciens]
MKFTGSDAAIKENESDKYGYCYIAKGLAQSIMDVDDVDGVVIGIEGRWGSGKSSLLNLLSNEIKSLECKNVHVIKLAPWASGERASIVSSLLVPVANIIRETDRDNMSPGQMLKDKSKDKVRDYSGVLYRYIKKTSGLSSAVLDVAGLVIPGAGYAGKILDAVGKIDLSEYEGTIEEEKERIAIKIKELGIRFIVMIDDLDRLEPEQAVEVVRLVKSVANFPHFTYLMCYDRNVLSHAIKQGVKVNDGEHYLQKIVQLSFSIPLPEVFDLRNELRSQLIEYYRFYNNSSISDDMNSEFEQVIDVFGSDITVPREVKSILNSFCFVYPNVFDKVYFPDFCFLLIVKCVKPELYGWIENYLRTRSVIATRHASVGKAERKRIGESLKEILPESDDLGSPSSIFSLHGIIPGLNSLQSSADIAFNQVSEIDENDMRRLKRLGSSSYYRYYFAFSPPKNVFPESSYKELIDLAENNSESFYARMLELIVSPGFAGLTWFEYIVDQMNFIYIKEMTTNQINSFLSFFFKHSDDVFVAFEKRRGFFSMSDLRINNKVDQLFKELFERGGSRMLIDFVADGRAINWIVSSYFRDCMWNHGIVGHRALSMGELIFKDDDINKTREFMNNRLIGFPFNDFSVLPSKGGFLYGWAEISSYEMIKVWVKENTKDSDSFIVILNALRTRTISNKVSYPLHEKSIECFFELDEVKKRLNDLNTEDAKEILSAMEEAKYF